MKKINQILSTMFTGGAIVSGLDTLFILACGIYAAALGMLTGLTDHAQSIAVVIAAIFSGFAAYVLDGGLHAILPGTLKGYASKQHLGHRKLYGYLLAVCLLLGVSSIGITIMCRDFVAHTVVGEAPQQSTALAVSAINESTAAAMARIDGDIATIQRERKAAVAAAGNPSLRQMAASGNAWAKAELERLREKAAAPYSQRLADAQSARLASATAGTAQAQHAAQEIAAANAAALTRNQAQRHTVGFIQMVLAIGGTVLMFVSAIGKALLFAAYGIGDDPYRDITSRSPGAMPTPPLPVPAEPKATPGPASGVVRPLRAAVRQPPVYPAETAVPAVITQTEQKLQLIDEVEGVQFFGQNGRLTKVCYNGIAFDETKLRQYVRVYEKRANESLGAATRERNAQKAAMFRDALNQIYSQTA